MTQLFSMSSSQATSDHRNYVWQFSSNPRDSVANINDAWTIFIVIDSSDINESL